MHSHYQTGLKLSLNEIVRALRTYPTIDGPGIGISGSCTASIGVLQGTLVPVSASWGVIVQSTHIFPRRLGDREWRGKDTIAIDESIVSASAVHHN